MIITSIETLVKPFSADSWLDQQLVSTPMSVIPRYALQRSTWRGPGSDLAWVLLRTDDPNIFGVGQSRGGAVTASLINEHLTQFIIRRNAEGINQRIYEMRMATLPYADGGLNAMALSAIELALWDLLSRAAEQPLSLFLGGIPDDRTLPYYLTVPQINIMSELDPEIVANAYTIKIPATHGPANGHHGLKHVVDNVKEIREYVPEHVPISIDCFMSWDIPFTLEFARKADQYGLGWIEEPLLPKNTAGYAELAQRLPPISIAGGEHLHGITDGAQFIRSRAAQVLQIDVTWCGGLSVANTLGRLAVDNGMIFAPHAASMQPWSLHLVSAFGPGALLEIITGMGQTALVPKPVTTPGVGIEPKTIGFA